MGSSDISQHLSFWEKRYLIDDVDVTIIGSGIVGVSTAIAIKEVNPSLKVVVLDKSTLPLGASTKNAGFVCFGSISEILDDIEQLGEADAMQLVKMRYSGIQLLKERTRDCSIGYRDEPGVEIFQNEQESDYYISQIPKVNALLYSSLGIKNVFVEEEQTYGKVVVNRYEGSLHPDLMMTALHEIARNSGVRFLGGISIQEVDHEKGCLISDKGQLSFNKLAICTNGFTHPLLPSKDILPARNQVFITKPIFDFSLDGCYHMNEGYVYFREINGRLLIGGGRNLDKKGEQTSEFGFTDQIINYLKSIAEERIIGHSKFEIEHQWSGIMGVGKSKRPIVETIGEDVVLAARLSGMGVAIGSYLGNVACAELLGVNNTEYLEFVR